MSDEKRRWRKLDPTRILRALRCAPETFRTEAVKNNSDNPVWRDFFVFPDCPHNGRVDLEIWNKNFLGRDDPLGMVGLKAHQVLDLQGESAEGNFDTWLYLLSTTLQG